MLPLILLSITTPDRDFLYAYHLHLYEYKFLFRGHTIHILFCFMSFQRRIFLLFVKMETLRSKNSASPILKVYDNTLESLVENCIVTITEQHFAPAPTVAVSISHNIPLRVPVVLHTIQLWPMVIARPTEVIPLE